MADITKDTVFPHTPILRDVTAKTVDRHGPWARVLFDMYVAAERRHARCEVAAFDAAEAAGVGSPDKSEAPDCRRTYAARQRCRKAMQRVSMYLALEIAGRLDGKGLNSEIVKCITSPEGHMDETIIRRLFKAKHIEWLDYEWRQSVYRRMERMREADRLAMSWGFGRQRHKWYVVTQAVLDQREAGKVHAAKSAAEQKVREAREAALVEFMKSKGVAVKAKYGHVEIDLGDMETLLGL